MNPTNSDLARILHEGMDTEYCNRCARACQRRSDHWYNKAAAAPSIREATEYRREAGREAASAAYWNMMAGLAYHHNRTEG